MPKGGKGGKKKGGGGGSNAGSEASTSSAPSRPPQQASAPAPAPARGPSAPAQPTPAAPQPLQASTSAPGPPVPAAGPSVPVVQSSAERGVSSRAIVAAKRSGFGTAGRPVMLLANHFKLQFPADLVVYHYDAAFTPAMPSKRLCRSLMRALVRSHQGELGGTPQHPALPVYDGGKSLFAARALPFDQETFRVALVDEQEEGGGGGGGGGGGEAEGGRRQRMFSVTLTKAGQYDMEGLLTFLRGQHTEIPQVALQALDIALRERPLGLYPSLGSSFYSSSFGATDLTGGVAGWRGFFQSVRPTQQGLVLNVDVSASPFHKAMPVVEFAAQLLNRRGFDPSSTLADGERLRLKKALQRVQVTVTHRRTSRRYRISGVSREQVRNYSFEVEDQGPTTLVDYFWTQYQYRVRYPGLPALLCGKSALPMECCVIVEGQRYGPKLSDIQVSNLLKFTCTKPDQRKADIRNIVQSNHVQPQGSGGDPHAREFGLRVDPQMTQLRGRILDTPRLAYLNKNEVQPRFGSWNMMQGQKLVNGVPIANWGIVNFCRTLRPAAVDFFRQALVQRCQELGVQMNPNMVGDVVQGNIHHVDPAFVDMARRQVPNQPGHLQLVIVLLPDRGPFYHDIKRICETGHQCSQACPPACPLDRTGPARKGLVTQCVLQKHAQRAQSQYLANLILKINVKCGGRNVLLASEYVGRLPMVHEKATILFGADVSHPPPGDDMNPSIAAVVASQDWPCANRYTCYVRAQAHRREMIDGLHMERTGPGGVVEAQGIVRNLLFQFYQCCGRRKPDRIIFFRDGVSEGQFYQVLAHELNAVKRACVRMDASGSYSPAITYVVVQKRHHTRLFPADPRDADKNGNVQPGTVVDTAICHPREFDFFLNSHASIQGTSRPTHYRVLWDENGFTADSMQALCYQLCHTYARCTRTVSLVPPAYYADLAATRGRMYVEGLMGSLRDSESETGSQAGKGPPAPQGAAGEEGSGQGGGSAGTGQSSSSSSRRTPPLCLRSPMSLMSPGLACSSARALGMALAWALQHRAGTASCMSSVLQNQLNANRQH